VDFRFQLQGACDFVVFALAGKTLGAVKLSSG